MYQVGDLVVYGSDGVCRITEISERREIGVRDQTLCYTLRPLYQSYVISAPVGSNKIYMRPVISKEEAEHLIDAIPSVSSEPISGAQKELAEHYRAAVDSHDCRRLVRLTMSIHAKEKQALASRRKVGAMDQKYMKRAESLLFGELAVALGIERDEVPHYIAARLEGRIAE
jgi:CarD family transcriptional regulator